MDELSEIHQIFVEFENAADPEIKVKKFKVAIDRANECLGRSDLTETDLKKLNNFKRSYTRTLLNSLPSSGGTTFALWLDYFVALVSVNSEREELFQLNPTLRDRFDEFLNLHKEELRRLAKLK